MKYLLVISLAILLPAVGGVAWWQLHQDTNPSEDEPAGPAWFADVTKEVGLTFRHSAGPLGKYFLPETFGSGAALFDFDGDGRLDIYLLTNGGPKSESINRLYKNMPDGTFKRSEEHTSE